MSNYAGYYSYPGRNGVRIYHRHKPATVFRLWAHLWFGLDWTDLA